MSLRSPISKFAVVTTQRTGSSWLIDLLNSHPEIRSFSEVFLDQRRAQATPKGALTPPQWYAGFRTETHSRWPWTMSKYLDLLESWSEGASSVGFKLMYNQWLVHPELLIEMARRRYRILHLRRRNSLDIVLSLKRMKETGVAHRLGDSPRSERVRQPIHLDPRTLPALLARQSRQARAAHLILRLCRFPVLEVSYESLCTSLAESMGKISRFLSVPEGHTWHSDVKKLSVGSHRDQIANFDKVAAALSRTRFKGQLRV